MDEPQLDWLTQDSPSSSSNYGYLNDNPPTSTFGTANTVSADSASSYDGSSHDYDNNNVYSTNDANNNNINLHYPTTTTTFNYDDDGTMVSQRYKEQGLDMLSGNQPGFGAVQGVESTGGDVSYRGSANDVKVQGKVGDTGAVMGGNFGNSVGGASGRSSARYSEGRGFSEYGDNDDH